MRYGITEEEIEALSEGKTIRIEDADLGMPGHNGVVELTKDYDNRPWRFTIEDGD